MALWLGLAAHGASHSAEVTLAAITITQPPTVAPPRQPQRHAGARRAPPGAAGKAGERAPVYAPAASYRPPISPIPVSPMPQQGTATLAGSAALGTGPGSGSAGTGDGSGGDGGSGGEGARWTGGRIRDSDYPRDARDAGAQGTTAVAISVDARGRVAGCRVTGSSGNASLDAATCRLIARRFRFAPAHDEAGRAVPDTVDYDQEWINPPPPGGT